MFIKRYKSLENVTVPIDGSVGKPQVMVKSELAGSLVVKYRVGGFSGFVHSVAVGETSLSSSFSPT